MTTKRLEIKAHITEDGTVLVPKYSLACKGCYYEHSKGDTYTCESKYECICRDTAIVYVRCENES